MSPGTCSGVVASAALVAVISLVSILQACNWTRISTLARQYHPTIDWHKDLVQYAVLGLSE